MFDVLKVIHVVLAMIAVGANATYGFWLARAERDKAHRLFTLNGVRLIDNRIANPAYGLLLITGLAMAFMTRLQAQWLMVSFLLYLFVVLGGLFGYTPTLRKQIRLVEANASDAEYAPVARRGRTIGILLGVLTLAIVILMVTKPSF